MRFSRDSEFLVGKYLRLSREDGDKMESDSIRNQRELISEYIGKHPELRVVEEYVDDGYSGTNFERPGFQRLLKDIDNKKINCIVVKDLSRLGRNYIEVGKYLEREFPTKGVRFIAINDNYDSFDEKSDSDQIVIPFKNLINDAYCRDISIKVRSQLDVKRKNGQFIGSFASYGYCKDPENKNHLLVDPDAAEIVRLIFSMRVEGFSAKRIAEKLNEMKAATPYEYKRMNGYNYNSGFHTGSDPKWSAVNVLRILKNEIYTGVMIQGKCQKINYKVKQFRVLDEAEWIRVEGTHDPIIPKEVFECVQELMKRDTRTAPDMDCVYPFSGYLKCPACGQNMKRRSSSSHGKTYYYYHCSTYSNGDGCSAHLISEKELTDFVLASVRLQAKMLIEAKTMMEKEEGQKQAKPRARAIDTQIVSLREEIDRYQDLCIKLYQDMHGKIITTEEYQNMNSRFMEKIKEAKDTVKELEQRRSKLMDLQNGEKPWMKLFYTYKDVDRIDRQMVVSLIDKIIIHSKKQIEIVFRYGDEMNDYLSGLTTNLADKQLPERRASEIYTFQNVREATVV